MSGARYVVACPPDEGADEALALGQVLTAGTDILLEVATVSPAPWPVGTAGAVDAEFIAFTEQRAADVLERARERLGPDVKAEFVVLHAERSVAATLVEHAEEVQADGVVLGSSRKLTSRRVSLGSTALSLLHRAGVPLATAPLGYTPPPGTPVSRVTVGVSGSGGQSSALQCGLRLAQERGVPLRLATVQVLDADQAIPVAGFDAERVVDTQWRGQLEDLHAELLASLPPEVEASSTVVSGPTWAEGLDALDPLVGEVLVIGSSGAGLMSRVFLGTHSTKIVRNTGMPVIVTPYQEG